LNKSSQAKWKTLEINIHKQTHKIRKKENGKVEMQDESDKNQVHLANRMRVGDHKQVETQTDTLHSHTPG